MSVSSSSIALDRFTTFGDLLRYLRRRAGYTQRELSIAVGYSDTQISRLEHNERLPDLATLTARFLPILEIEDEPEVAARLLELAAAVRREDAPTTGISPYKGLQFFDEDDAELFFGREALTARLTARLTALAESDQRFLAVVGASGSGKSSVVRAGLVPSLRWRPSTSGWPIFVMTPTAHPLENLAVVLRGDSASAMSSRKLADDLVSQPDMLGQVMGQLGELAASPAPRSLLVVDQFEELFTLCRSESEQFAFVQNLTTAACQHGGIGVIVVVLRADFYAHCARFDRLRQLLAQQQEYIGPMTADELRCAIEEPAREGHWQLEPGLVDLLLHDIGADTGQHNPEPGALPLLSHALLATWERRRGRTLTLSGYTASGGVRGAIAETAESVFYDQLDREQRQIARHIFLRLTELGGDEAFADTRRRVSIDELASRPEERETVHQVLSALADARLITTDQNAVDVAHEALIREWPTLRGWLEEDREGLRLHRHLTEASQEWDEQGRDPGGLYRGARLAQAMEWAAAHPDDLNALEQAFLDASQALAEKKAREREAQRQRELESARQLAEAERVRAEEQARANGRLRQRAALLAVALVIGLILGAAALAFAQRANQAEQLALSRELAAAAATNLDIDAERSTLLALAALEQADTLEARNALHRALPELHLLRTLPAHKGGVPDVAFSPDGARLASLGAFNDFTVWDARTGEPLLQLRDEAIGYGNSIAFSPDGRQLATAGVTEVILWDAITGEKLHSITGESVGTTVGYNLGVGQISFSPDGRRLAAANMDGVSKVWDLASRTEGLTLLPDGLPAKALAYSPDGRFLATGGDEGIVTMWDAIDGTQIYTATLGGIIHSVTFSPDGASVAAASEDGRAKIWETANGRELVNLPRLSGMYDIAFLADGRLATAGQDGVTRVWDPATGQQALSLAASASTIIGVAGSPDGSVIATGSYDGNVRLWDAAPGHELLTIPAHDGIVWNVTYFADGSRFASAGVDGKTKIWETGSGRLLQTLTGGEESSAGFTGLVISMDGSQIAAGGMDGIVTIWDSGTGDVVSTLSGHNALVTGLDFSPEGRRLATASWDGTAKVWDAVTGAEIITFAGHAPASVINGVFSPEGRSVFTSGGDYFVRQWDAETGEEIRAFSGEGKELFGVALSPDGQTMAMGDQDGVITIWNVTTGDRLHTMAGHAGLTLRLAFNHDGTRLASTGFDRLAKVWDVASGEELFSLYGNLSNVFGVAFSPDGSTLAVAGADGTVRTFTLAMDELVSLAESRLTRELTDEECRKFLHVEACPP
ncbi:MAG: PQQ-binding-like beta-propeller repeat protein [Caldilineales bacterium]|nr:PQQ-binding-like beta-propeller repeat protein [Caldilineales bacterium]